MKLFFTASDKIEHIMKSFNLTRTLYVSSIIIGERYTGKKSLLRHLYPDTTLVSGSDEEDVKKALEDNNELIIVDFEKLKNKDTLDFSNKRVIATANYMGNEEIIDDMFAFIYYMPPLVEREEDVVYLANIFKKEATDMFMVDDDIEIKSTSLSLTHNTKSLRRSIYFEVIKQCSTKDDLEDMLFNYMLKNIDGKNAYKDHLPVYEVPLIKAGLQKFGSQLQLSAILGINRNTLRKKINEHDIH